MASTPPISFNPFMPFPKRIVKQQTAKPNKKENCHKKWTCTRNRAYCSQCGNYSMFIAIKHDDEGENDCFLCDEPCEYFYLCRYRNKYGCHSKHLNDGDPTFEDMEKPEFVVSKHDM